MRIARHGSAARLCKNFLPALRFDRMRTLIVPLTHRSKKTRQWHECTTQQRQWHECTMQQLIYAPYPRPCFGRLEVADRTYDSLEPLGLKTVYSSFSKWSGEQTAVQQGFSIVAPLSGRCTASNPPPVFVAAKSSTTPISSSYITEKECLWNSGSPGDLAETLTCPQTFPYPEDGQSRRVMGKNLWGSCWQWGGCAGRKPLEIINRGSCELRERLCGPRR